ncbi:MarC family protein [Salinarimonas rosea]|uniref:MarC family protein n=1 Tax=Salinarimonas rosea TaxID=552063 RepID=UPI0004028DD1|nr:MarC family protein [Salinarimonas rosea]
MPSIDITALVQEFAVLFAVIDPVGTIPVFLAATAGIAAERRAGVAVRAVLIAALVLVGFIAVGQIFLEAVGVSLVSFQIAGGIVLFLFALGMIFGEAKPDQERALVEKSDAELAVYPLAIPSIAGPGAMLSVVLLTDNRAHPVIEQVLTAAMMLVVLAIVLALMLAASWLHRYLGNAGAAIISRVMGLVLAALAVETILNAVLGLLATR